MIGVAASLPEAAAEAEHVVQRRLLADAVVGQRPAVVLVELLPGEDEGRQLVRVVLGGGAGDSLLVLDPSFDGVDGVSALDLERESLPGDGLDEDLHWRGRGWRWLPWAAPWK